MAPQTMSEKEAYLDAFEREYQTTLKVLRAYPPEKTELQPSPELKNARGLAWMLTLNQMVVEILAERDELMPGSFPEAPGSWPEILRSFEEAHRSSKAKAEKLTDAAWNAPIRMPTGPQQIGETRRSDALWFMLFDTIHHRGQFSVYLRMAGGKVPSIYGPSKDEPWF